MRSARVPTLFFYYFSGPSLGEKWKKYVINKYGQKPEIDCFSTEGLKGLKPFEESFLSKYMTKSGRVLDIGCGTGREAFPLAKKGHEVVGIDMTPAMIARARENTAKNSPMKGIVEFHVGEAGELKLPDTSFDYVLMIAQLIQHIHGKENRMKALSEAWRVLKPGGVLFLTIRNQIGLTGSFVLNFVYRRMKGVFSPGNGGGPVTRNYPGLLRTGLHGLYIRVISGGVDAWRRGAIGILDLLGRTYGGREPGDYLVPNISPAESTGLVPFHCYSFREIKDDLASTGFEVMEYRDTLEIGSGLDFPDWVRRGARHLIISCKKVHKV